MDSLTTDQYKTYANNIVGTWYNEMPGEVLVFSFLYDYTQQSDLLIIDKGVSTETTYCIQNTPGSEWLLIIWDEQTNKTIFYHIDVLSPDMLVLKNKEQDSKIYLRDVDNAFVYSVLNKIP